MSDETRPADGSAPIWLRRRTPEERLAYLLMKRDQLQRDGSNPSMIELLDAMIAEDGSDG